MNGDYSPTLVVGIGGTGASVLRRIKRRMLMYDPQERQAERVKLLLIDGAAGEQHSGDPRLHFTNEEFFNLSLDYDPPRVQEQIDADNPAYCHIDWVPPRKQFPLPSAGEGLAQTRCVGRLALFQQYDSLDARIRSLVDQLNIADGRPEPHVYLVCSLCGGTGAGTFLDVAYLLRRHAHILRSTLTGFLVLPGGFASVDIDQKMISANAYAALRELDHFMTERHFACQYSPEGTHQVDINESPFDSCFLVEAETERGQKLERGYWDVAQMIGEAVFLNFASEVGKALRGKNINLTAMSGEFQGKRKAYSSLGLRALVMPLEQAQQRSGPYLGLSVVNRLLGNPPPSEKDMEDRVNRFIRDQDLAQMVEDHQLVEELKAVGPGGTRVWFKTPEDVDLASLRTVGDQIRSLLNKHHNQAFVELQQKMSAKAAELLSPRAKEIVQQACALLDDPACGFSYAEAFLAALKAHLDQSRATLLEQQEARKKKKTAADQELAFMLEDMERFGRALFPLPGKRQAELEQRLPTYLEMADKNKGREVAMLARAEAGKLLQQLSDATAHLLNRVAELRKVLQTKVLPVLMQTPVPANSTSLERFSLEEEITQDEDLLKNVRAADTTVAGMKPSTWLNLEEKRILEGDTLLQRLVPPEKARFALTFPRIDERLADYMGRCNKDNSALLASLENGSLPCLRFNKERLGASEQPATTEVLAGPPDTDPLDGKSQSKNVCSAGDHYRLTMIQERHGLPLLVVSNLETYRKMYDIVQDRNQGKVMLRPLHCFKEAEQWSDPLLPEGQGGTTA